MGNLLGTVGEELAALQASPQPMVAALVWSQAAENLLTPVTTLKPFTVGTAPFQEFFDSFINSDASTYNHLDLRGWNAQAFYGGPNAVANKAAIAIGLEDNYYDGSAYGAEFYVEFQSPDAATTLLFRPFYARVTPTNANTAVGAAITHDIGNNAASEFVIKSGATTILNFTTTQFEVTVGTLFTTNMVLGVGGASQSILTINSTNPTMEYQIAGAVAWYWQALGINNFTISDKNGRAHITLTEGTVSTALTNFASTVRIQTLGAFASGDKYVIADSSGNLHLSATGPAS